MLFTNCVQEALLCNLIKSVKHNYSSNSIVRLLIPSSANENLSKQFENESSVQYGDFVSVSNDRRVVEMKEAFSIRGQLSNSSDWLRTYPCKGKF
ncbi:hypothetical protein VIBNIFTn2_120148 [Vibrio nigripulchritudo FTn2]|nr:hypothetical protein VIBNIFTn2_120148 [Vibrio nigripulchritudo FTn2]